MHSPMSAQSNQFIGTLVTGNGTIIGSVRVDQIHDNGLLTGKMISVIPNNEINAIFTRLEEMVNTGVFSVLDDLEKKIALLNPFFRHSGEEEMAVEDLQIYPSTLAVSFRRK